MSSDDDWVTVEGVRYVPEAPLKGEIARLRAALEEISNHEYDHACYPLKKIARKALDKERE